MQHMCWNSVRVNTWRSSVIIGLLHGSAFAINGVITEHIPLAVGSRKLHLCSITKELVFVLKFNISVFQNCGCKRFSSLVTAKPTIQRMISLNQRTTNNSKWKRPPWRCCLYMFSPAPPPLHPSSSYVLICPLPVLLHLPVVLLSYYFVKVILKDWFDSVVSILSDS